MPFTVRRAHLSAVSMSVLVLSLIGATAAGAEQTSTTSKSERDIRESIVNGRYVEAPENSKELPEYLRPSVRFGQKKENKKARVPKTKNTEAEKNTGPKRPTDHRKNKIEATNQKPKKERTAANEQQIDAATSNEQTKSEPIAKDRIDRSDTKRPAQKAKKENKTAALDRSDTDPIATEPDVAPPPADPVIETVRSRLQNSKRFRNDSKDDVAALKAFYNARTKPVWVDETGTNANATAIIEEINKAEDWGLDLRMFRLPKPLGKNANTQSQAQFELNLARNFLRYARFARGGRTNPRRLSRILDFTPPVKDPAVVLEEIANASEPDAYLRNLHPQHEQFKRLREALLRARGPQKPRKPVAPVVLLPRKGPNLSVGSMHADVGRLRQRFNVPTPIGENPHYYDEAVAKAVRAYQKKSGLRQNGRLTRKTRRKLSRRPRQPIRLRGKSLEQRLLVNMEKWRWMAVDVGDFHVWNNVPEFAIRVMKNGKQIWREKIIVGLAEWPTPALSSHIEHTIFYPSWGVPTGIKQRELLPRIRRASKPQGLFDALFSGGYNGGAAVLKAYNLTVYKNGRKINPSSVNWSTANIHAYSFIQPPGGTNPLGVVKFTFPNKFTVYMHDTIEPELFARSRRTLSHGCLRIRNPRKLAELLYMHEKGVPQSQARAAARRGTSFKLENPVPVHLTYFTALIDDNGKMQTFSDIYGHDRRVARAILGRNVRYRDPPPQISSDESFESTSEPRPQRRTVRRKKKRIPKKKKAASNSNFKMPTNLSEAVAGGLSY